MFDFVKKFGKYAFLFARNRAHVALYLLVFFLCSICFGSVIFSGFLMSFDMSGCAVSVCAKARSRKPAASSSPIFSAVVRQAATSTNSIG